MQMRAGWYWRDQVFVVLEGAGDEEGVEAEGAEHGGADARGEPCLRERQHWEPCRPPRMASSSSEYTHIND
eukprot:2389011-Rhodomonas_salina.1